MAICLLASPPLAADSLRCPRGLVVTGDPEFMVMERCGEPTGRSRSLKQLRLGRGQWIEIPVEAWVYDFGPHRLLKRVWIENGVLTRVESGPLR